MVLKIIKHCQEALPSFVTGQLLGLDIGRTLEVTNCFPFPNKNDDAAAPAGGGAEEDGDEDGAEYQMHMMQCLREVNVDNNTVGWYQSTYFSSFIDDSCIDTQFNYQVSVRVRVMFRVTRRGEGSGAGQRAEPCSPARAHAHTHAHTWRVPRAAWHLRAAGPSRGWRAAEHQILACVRCASRCPLTRMPVCMRRAGEHQELRGDHLRPLAHAHDRPRPARLPADRHLHDAVQGGRTPGPLALALTT